MTRLSSNWIDLPSARLHVILGVGFPIAEHGSEMFFEISMPRLSGVLRTTGAAGNIANKKNPAIRVSLPHFASTKLFRSRHKVMQMEKVNQGQSERVVVVVL